MRKFDFDQMDKKGEPLRITRNCSMCGQHESARQDLRPTQFIAEPRTLKRSPGGEMRWENSVHFACQGCRRKWQGAWRVPSYHPHEDVAPFVCYASQFVRDVRALTLTEPWAWLIEQGFKDVENRQTHFKFTGRMFIHASKVVSDSYETIRKMVFTHNGIELPTPEWLQRNRCGRIVAVMEVGEMESHIDSPWKMKGQWAWPIKWCHSLNPTEVIRGSQGFWRVPTDNMRVSCLPL